LLTIPGKEKVGKKKYLIFRFCCNRWYKI